jgi:hypothetical protein
MQICRRNKRDHAGYFSLYKATLLPLDNAIHKTDISQKQRKHLVTFCVKTISCLCFNDHVAL